MYRVELCAQVRRRVFVEGISEREAATRFGIAREKVRKMLRYATPPGYERSKPVRRPKLAPFTGIIDQILARPSATTSPDQVLEAILGELGEPFRPVALAAYWTACRKGEILSWRWEYIDLDGKVVPIPEAKDGRPRRIPLAQPVCDALLLLGFRRERDWPSSPWVLSLDGIRPLSQWTYRSAWERACKAAGVGKRRFHGLRHTAITNNRAAGVEEGTIMAMSGHWSRAVFDRYGIQPEGSPPRCCSVP